jgi:hypothetical protein
MTYGTERSKNKKESLTIANFDFSDEIEDLDDLNFKIINEGLGFHQAEKKTSKRKAPQPTLKPLSARNHLRPDLNTIDKNYISDRPQELAAFYTPKKDKLIEKEKIEKMLPTQNKKIIRKKQVKAPMFLQMTAWLIDVLFVLMVLGLTLSVLSLVSGIEISYFREMLVEPEISIYMAGLFFIYYLLYFSILDLAGTFGKTLMGLSLRTVNNKPLRVRHTFVRAFITLTSFLAIGLPLVIDFQGRLSETKVIR